MDLLARTQGPEEAVYTPADCKKVKFNLKILKYAKKKLIFFNSKISTTKLQKG